MLHLRRLVVIVALVVWVGSSAPPASAGEETGERPPNVVFVLTDDQRWDCLGLADDSVINTPNIDRLASEGALFTNALCTNSICSPSRACILTGQYCHTNGAFDLSGKVEPGNQMLPIQMRKAGYQTAMIGKWHLKDEPAEFDYYCDHPGQGKYHDPEFRIRGEKPWAKNVINFDGKHLTDEITDLTFDCLGEGWDRD